MALNLDEQKRLIADIGDHPALILRNHGLLTVGRTPGQAFLRMHYLNKACEIQVAATRAGEVILPDPAIAEHTAQQLSGQDAGDDYTDDVGLELAWQAMLRLVERVAPDYRE